MNVRNIIGGVIGSFEDYDYERETSLVSMELKEKPENGKFPSTGTLEGFNNQTKAEQQKEKQEQAAYERRFYQALKDEQIRTQQAKDRMWLEEEINDITANISTEEKNILLHYQTSYKDKSIYQKAELRRKIIEQRRKAEKQEKQASIPSPAKKASALEAAFEGGSGTQGSGTANLSAQATG